MAEIKDIQIFLSYASPDKERVLPIYSYLIKNGYPNSWIDCKKLLPGQSWELEIQRNLKKSEIVLFFLSNISVNKRGYVQRELKTILKYLEEKLFDDIYIIPIKLDSNISIPEELLKIQYLDFSLPTALSLLKESLDAQSQKLGYKPVLESNSYDNLLITKKNVQENWEGLPGYEVDYSVPVLRSADFPNIGEISTLIEASFIRRLHIYRQEKMTQMPESFSYSQFHYHRTSTFDARYDSIFLRNNIMSIPFLVQWYGAGAAHPNRNFECFNFILNPLLQIESIKDIFEKPDDFLYKLIEIIREKINNNQFEDEQIDSTDRGNFDPEWVAKGTSEWESFNAFTFTDEGLRFSFPPYQIAAYAAGSFHVIVPYEVVSNELRHTIRHALAI